MARFRCEPPCRLGAACFDLNGLKGWNDRYGHSAGDALIRRAGEVIAAVFPGKAYRLFLIVQARTSGSPAVR